MILRKLAILIFCCICLSGLVLAGDGHGQTAKFAENKGQWESHIRYVADIPYGRLFMEDRQLVYVFQHAEDMDRIHEMGHGHTAEYTEKDLLVRGHCFKMHFKDAATDPVLSGEEQTVDYLNYFLGNDPDKWATDVKQYGLIDYEQIYAGIDFRMYSSEGHLKYDLILAPGADPEMIRLEYEGLDDIFLKDGQLHLKTSVNEIIERHPVAYQLIDGKRQEVKCEFVLKGSTVSFGFPEGYNPAKELIIDPVLVFSSYSGSTKDNWGYTATYDHQGNLYGGGIVFERFGSNSGGNYPLVGAFQSNYGGGQIDMGISKFSSDGSTLIYSTYIGGGSSDAPHSLVVNSNNELVIMGTSGSIDYPVSAGAVDGTYNGGNPALLATTGLVNYSNGSDIVVTKLNSAGNNLMASTYVGGSQNDGLNLTTLLVQNYGDESRGEVYVDNADNIYVSSSTQSFMDFPVVNAVQNTFGGGSQDGCVFKLNSSMTTLMWSTYLGGSGEDAAYSVQIDGSGNALIAGGTTSSNFPTTSGVLHPTRRGGVDGFITKLNPAGSSIVASTYIGTTNYDQNFFVQYDGGDSVYVVGQTMGSYPVSPAGVFSQPNGGQYIHKLTPGLDNTVFSMVFGTNRPNQVDISLSAFLVNDCDHIYVSGWGGAVNNNEMPGSSTSGLTTSTGAHKTTTDGSDFYLIALAENADSIIYATFFGAVGIAEHVDGGTSRFDKKGIVYQAVCAGCGSSNAFPTTPGAWSQLNGSPNCNLGVIKFDMSKPHSSIFLSSPPYVCVPGTVNFGNQSVGTDFFWDFGDGTTSTDFEPTHFYADTGTYEVMLIVSDSALCVTTDTSFVTIRGVPPPDAEIQTVPPICKGANTQLISSAGKSWKWFPSTGLSDDTIQDPVASPDTSTTYRVIITDSCGSDTAEIRVEVLQDPTSVMDDTVVCVGNSIQLFAEGGVSYNWTPTSSLNNPSVATPLAKPAFTTAYAVEIKDKNGCTWYDTLLVEVDPDLPQAIVDNDTIICTGESVQLHASGGSSFRWEPPLGLNNPMISSPVATPPEGITYTVFVSNSCGTVSDEVRVEIDDILLLSVGDSVACLGRPARLSVAGADFYEWQPAALLDRNDVASPQATITEPTLFTVVGTTVFGCKGDTSFLLKLREPPYVEAGADILLDWGKSVILEPEGTGDFEWSPIIGLNCDNCPNPEAKPQITTTYYLTLTDEYGCVSTDSLTIYVAGSVYVPNTFTPNGDGRNDFFYAVTTGLVSFELSIYNRWGELIFHTESVEGRWDGTFEGDPAPADAYVWQIHYREESGREGSERGLVNLIR